MTEHSKLPWRISKFFPEIVMGADGSWAADCVNFHCSKANAAFIVKACNAHDELVEALTRIANGDGVYGAQAHEYKTIARAALAKLDGGNNG